MTQMDRNTLEDIFQGIIMNFEEMNSTNLDGLENETLDAKEAPGVEKGTTPGDILICRRRKLRGMRWSRKGADAVLSIRILVCNGEWDDFWTRYKAA